MWFTCVNRLNCNEKASHIRLRVYHYKVKMNIVSDSEISSLQISKVTNYHDMRNSEAVMHVLVEKSINIMNHLIITKSKVSAETTLL